MRPNTMRHQEALAAVSPPTKKKKRSQGKRAAFSRTKRHRLGRLINDDPQSWACFYSEYYPLIRWCVQRVLQRYRYLHSESDLEDIISEVWVSLLQNNRQKLRVYDATRLGIPGWLRIVAMQCATDQLRARLAQKRNAAAPLPTEMLWPRPMLPDEQLEQQEWIEQTLFAIEQLRKKEQDLIQLVAQGADTTAIAKALGIKSSAIYSRRHRIRERLHRLLSKIQQRPTMAMACPSIC